MSVPRFMDFYNEIVAKKRSERAQQQEREQNYRASLAEQFTPTRKKVNVEPVVAPMPVQFGQQKAFEEQEQLQETPINNEVAPSTTPVIPRVSLYTGATGRDVVADARAKNAYVAKELAGRSSVPPIQDPPDAPEPGMESFYRQLEFIETSGKQETEFQEARVAAAKAAEAAARSAFAQQRAIQNAQFARTLTPVISGMSGNYNGKLPNHIGGQAVKIAMTALGTPYRFGGNSLSRGVDCSGLIQQVYAKLGIKLPRVSVDQARSGRKISSLSQAQAGDILQFNSPALGAGRHVGLYIGNGQFIHAPRTGDVVRIQNLSGYRDVIRIVRPW